MKFFIFAAKIFNFACDIEYSMQTTQKSFLKWQWKTIVVLMAGYAMFYLLRKNFSLAMPGLTAEFGINNTTLGIFLTLHGVIYGLSRYVVGVITDRNSARMIMALGLALCAAVNILFGMSDLWASLLVSIAGTAGDAAAIATALTYIMGVLWMVNGFLQGMGVPPCMKIMTHWVHPDELATKMSVWNMSHSIGAGLAMALCGYVIMPHLGWRWCFLIPAFVGIAGAIWLFFTLKNDPTDVGFNPVIGEKKSSAITSPEEIAEHKAFVKKHVYRNRVIWTLAVTNLFVYVVRFGALDWGVKILMEDRAMNFAMATTIVMLFELVGGNLGMVFWGWLTDRYLHSKAHHTCIICMIGVAVCIVAYWLMPQGAPWWVLLIPYMLMGFCIYGPQALLGICAAQHATNRASATANGILGIFGYMSTIISGAGFGIIADKMGWGGVYVAMLVASVVAIAVLVTIWGAKANGYEAE